MRFRPCIDIHNGKVKQIVGGTLMDEGDKARENFVSEQDASWFAALYRDADLPGGHVILLNSPDSPYYEATRRQAFLALGTYPGGLQLGGGVNPENACAYLDAGASHVIVTSYVFRDGRIRWENLEQMVRSVGRSRLVLDLSCRKKDGKYYIVTDRWQKFTDTVLTPEMMHTLSSFCDEFLVHAVDVEGKCGKTIGFHALGMHGTACDLCRRRGKREGSGGSEGLWKRPGGCNGGKCVGHFWRNAVI